MTANAVKTAAEHLIQDYGPGAREQIAARMLAARRRGQRRMYSFLQKVGREVDRQLRVLSAESSPGIWIG